MAGHRLGSARRPGSIRRLGSSRRPRRPDRQGRRWRGGRAEEERYGECAREPESSRTGKAAKRTDAADCSPMLNAGLRTVGSGRRMATWGRAARFAHGRGTPCPEPSIRPGAMQRRPAHERLWEGPRRKRSGSSCCPRERRRGPAPPPRGHRSVRDVHHDFADRAAFHRSVRLVGLVEREAEQRQAVFLADRQGAVAHRGGDVLRGGGERC